MQPGGVAAQAVLEIDENSGENITIDHDKKGTDDEQQNVESHLWEENNEVESMEDAKEQREKEIVDDMEDEDMTSQAYA